MKIKMSLATCLYYVPLGGFIYVYVYMKKVWALINGDVSILVN
jgi:hypothetical protein